MIFSSSLASLATVLNVAKISHPCVGRIPGFVDDKLNTLIRTSEEGEKEVGNQNRLSNPQNHRTLAKRKSLLNLTHPSVRSKARGPS